MMKTSIAIVSIIFLLLNGSYYKETNENQAKVSYKINPLLLVNFQDIRDTLYTMKDHIVEINLKTHQTIVRFRNGDKKVYPVSGGTRFIPKGIETREGLFVIHWKSKVQYSQQFDNAKMLYWMSFNGGIGMHALATRGYYKYLGKKNVSHGCVRMARDDAKELFRVLEKGTPVLVHNGESAITVEFGKLGEVYKYYSYSELKEKVKDQLNVLYSGKYFIANRNKLLIDEKNITASGLPVGNSQRIASKQILPPDRLLLAGKTSTIDRLKQILNGNVLPGSRLYYNIRLDSLYAGNL